MTLTHRTYLVLELNTVMDAGHHAGVTPGEAAARLEDGTLFPWLRQDFKLGNRAVIPEEAAREITAGLKDILDCYGDPARRKWGVAHNGICLLLAWVNELVQRRAWRDEPPEPDEPAAAGCPVASEE